MKRALMQSLLGLVITISTGAAFSTVPPTQDTLAAAGKMLSSAPVTMQGMLGQAQIQGTLRNKAEKDEGIEGEYFVSGQPQRVLLAGEIEGDDFFLEESENGKDVSGQWTGKLAGDTISGEWQSPDGKVTKPFILRIRRNDDTMQGATAGTPSNNQQQ
ncbi:MAG TPA: hypothetical protein VJ698_16545 [Noviherbaspirillum sp.]|uniref:hypothetical protein n=1 Tax=Noviherbaspirillum sp. TaxID=1926288 RepID=UPI002B494DF1|nr:hypothetical protein [Noviherbaspirillum sp.]HJV87075.1 hypothetical protein [Noviherbaspirillum sp.]